MQRTFTTFLFSTLILCACSINVAAPQAVSSPTPFHIAGTPYPNNFGCDTPYPYWVNKEAPALANGFKQSIQALQPGAQVNVFTAGLRCDRPDSSFFVSMEVDFEVVLQIGDLENKSSLGEWIVKIMNAIPSIPQEQIMQSLPRGIGVIQMRPEQISIGFQSGSAESVIQFYIDQYQALPRGLSNAEIYQALLKAVQ